MENMNKEIIKGIADYLEQDFTFSQVKFINKEIDEKYNREGFYIDLGDMGFDFNIFILNKNNAWDALRDRVEDLVTDTCDIPSWLEYYIDYDKLTDDSDRGEEFNGYDGTEYETDSYYIYKA